MGAEHPDLRGRILHLVERYPGLHLRDIQRRIGCSTMLAEYHLNVLEKLGLVTSTMHGRYRDFFPVHGDRTPLDKTARRWLALLRRPSVLAIALVLLEQGPLRPVEMAERLDLAPSTLAYQVKTMRGAGLVIHDPLHGRHRVRLAEPDRVLSLLRAHHPTPDLVTEYAVLWSSIFSRPREEVAVEAELADGGDEVPDEVAGHSRAVVAVYVALLERPMTQKEVRAETDLPRRTVYSALRRLRELGLVEARPDLRDTRQTQFRVLSSDERGAGGSQAKP